MRRTSFDGTFILVLLLNIALNFRLTIPAWILLALHFICGISIWWFVGALGVFFLYIFIWMLVLRLMGRMAASAAPDPVIENKNPYSSKGYTPINTTKEE